jgi:hypothetical protein
MTGARFPGTGLWPGNDPTEGADAHAVATGGNAGGTTAFNSLVSRPSMSPMPPRARAKNPPKSFAPQREA